MWTRPVGSGPHQLLLTWQLVLICALYKVNYYFLLCKVSITFCVILGQFDRKIRTSTIFEASSIFEVGLKKLHSSECSQRASQVQWEALGAARLHCIRYLRTWKEEQHLISLHCSHEVSCELLNLTAWSIITVAIGPKLPCKIRMR